MQGDAMNHAVEIQGVLGDTRGMKRHYCRNLHDVPR